LDIWTRLFFLPNTAFTSNKTAKKSEILPFKAFFFYLDSNKAEKKISNGARSLESVMIAVFLGYKLLNLCQSTSYTTFDAVEAYRAIYDKSIKITCFLESITKKRL